jgi:hypothetical protein
MTKRPLGPLQTRLGTERKLTEAVCIFLFPASLSIPLDDRRMTFRQAEGTAIVGELI